MTSATSPPVEPSPEPPALTSPGGTGLSDDEPGRATEDRLFISVGGPGTSEEVIELVKQAGGRVLRVTGEIGAISVSVPPGQAAPMLAALRGHPGVRAAGYDGRRHAALVPNDPLYGTDQAEYLGAAAFPLAWDTTTGASVTVAVVDTGVNAHAEFGARLLPGYDAVEKDSTPQDDNGHGTAVAGAIGAAGNNGEGIAGANWQVRLLPVRVLDAKGAGFDTDIADGIVWAVDNGADVINLSLAGPGTTDVLDSAVRYATTRGVLVVAAAGNESTTEPQYPAAAPGVLAVGATAADRKVAQFSNYGHWVDMVAPGVGIVTTSHTGGYVQHNGTSFAAPLVAGAASLVLGAHPDAGAEAVVNMLLRGSLDVGPPGRDRFSGFGHLDVAKALAGLKGGRQALASDSHEPDGMPVGITPAAQSTATIGHEGDVDWFTFDVPANGSLRVSVDPDGSATAARSLHVVAELFDGALRRLDGGTASSADRMLQIDVPVGAGVVWLRVHSALPSPSPSTYTTTFTYQADAVLSPNPGDQQWVRDVSVADGETATSPDLWVRFERAIDPATVTSSSVRLVDMSGRALASTVAFDEAAGVARLLLRFPLGPGGYRLEVIGVRDPGGDAMTDPVTIHFSVA